ncbi:hypothetical protein HKX48_008990, partial [Thoreauomyces humboldtii]
MTEVALHTADISTYQKNDDGSWAYKAASKDLTWLERYQEKGAFRDSATIKDLNKMVELVNGCHGEVLVGTTKAINMGRVRAFLAKAGHEKCGMTKPDFDKTLNRYSKCINDLKQTYKESRLNGTTPVIPFLPILDAAYEKERELGEHLYLKENPSKQEIVDYQESLMVLMQVAMPNSRSNSATLVNISHPETDPKKDNYFIPAEKGTSVIVWNE